ncbi:hypothetical protein ASPCADRAFT_212079 [Aspergillus carbonarius ITEM 5010]|uniref:Uncharacterized protein n=1 Tax=Aspergillus carbonarius (strain ITEM 5010) TaxID=602072 RepID=A0A1R3R761_ASPC5|nr:hypothetical protein ASPCADRAFT_212079 [Aspergillus carbonarius ITEM 5010]
MGQGGCQSINDPYMPTAQPSQSIPPLSRPPVSFDSLDPLTYSVNSQELWPRSGAAVDGQPTSFATL